MSSISTDLLAAKNVTEVAIRVDRDSRNPENNAVLRESIASEDEHGIEEKQLGSALSILGKTD